MIWLALSAGMVVAIAGLWWFAWLRRKHKPPKPSQPYREWKD
jgi:hypothetical protein